MRGKIDSEENWKTKNETLWSAVSKSPICLIFRDQLNFPAFVRCSKTFFSPLAAKKRRKKAFICVFFYRKPGKIYLKIFSYKWKNIEWKILDLYSWFRIILKRECLPAGRMFDWMRFHCDEVKMWCICIMGRKALSIQSIWFWKMTIVEKGFFFFFMNNSWNEMRFLLFSIRGVQKVWHFWRF